MEMKNTCKGLIGQKEEIIMEISQCTKLKVKAL